MELLPSSKRKLLRNRERNLCKKADELSILCGTDVCMIIFKPHKNQPETVPQDCTEVHRIIKKYKERVARRNNDFKGMRAPSSQAIRDATDAAITSRSTYSHKQIKKRKLDFNLSESYDSDCTWKRSHAEYNTMNFDETMKKGMQYRSRSGKHPVNELIGDDEAKLTSLEAKLQAITKIIALKEATSIC